MIRTSDFYTGDTVEKVLMEASSLNIRNEVLDLAHKLQQGNPALTQLQAVEEAFITLTKTL